MRKLLALAFLVLSTLVMPAFATVAIIQKSTSNTSSSHSGTAVAINVTAGDYVVVTGEMRGAAVTDVVYITDSVGNSYSVKYCPVGVGNSITFVGVAPATTALVSGTVTVADDTASTATANVFIVSSVSGSSGEDTAVRSCGGAGATTTPTTTSGTPTQSGDLIVSAYGSPSTSVGATWTEDTTNGKWVAFSTISFGSTTAVTNASYIINTGSGAVTHTPTTISKAYGFANTGFKDAGNPMVTIIGSTVSPIAGGDNNSSISTVVSSATTNDIPIGSLVYIAATTRTSASGFSSCADTGGLNTFPTPSLKATPGAQSLAWTYAITTADLPIGTTFTCNGGVSTAHGIRVAAFAGVGSHDSSGSATPTSGTGTVMSATSGTLACPGGGSGCEVLVDSWTNHTLGTQTSLSFSPSGQTTTLGCDTTNTAYLCLSYGIFNATTAQTFSSTNATSDVWAMDLEAFQLTGGSPPPVTALRHSLLLLGVGQ